jgi:hypothetical protein
MRTHLHNAKTALEHAIVEDAGNGPAKSNPKAKSRRTRADSARSVPKKKK